MGFQLDIKSLLYLFILGNLFSGLMITFYRYHFPKDIASSLFIASKWIQVVFWSSILLWDYIPHRIAVPLSNALILAGGGLEIAALLLMMGMLDRRAKLFIWQLRQEAYSASLSLPCSLTIRIYGSQRPHYGSCCLCSTLAAA